MWVYIENLFSIKPALWCSPKKGIYTSLMRILFLIISSHIFPIYLPHSNALVLQLFLSWTITIPHWLIIPIQSPSTQLIWQIYCAFSQLDCGLTHNLWHSYCGAQSALLHFTADLSQLIPLLDYSSHNYSALPIMTHYAWLITFIHFTI